MTEPGRGEDELALTLVHTADWHLGLRFPSFDDEDQKRLTRARLAVVEQILALAGRHSADAVLCAGDLFDEPSPAQVWWEGLAELLRRRADRPVFLLPGNHDPLVPGSVWSESHAFRRALPATVHVVDRDDYSHPLNDHAVLLAAPCRSKAGQRDLALSLPSREPGDERIRVGMVHGSTFDLSGHQTNFPIAEDAAVRRGLDYLAIGDTHSFRRVPPNAAVPTVYPGAPESTSFDEPDSGGAACVLVTRRRHVHVVSERVGYWRWVERTATSLQELSDIAGGLDLEHTVMRLVVDMRLAPEEYDEAERLLAALKGTHAALGRVGVLQIQRRLELDTGALEEELGDLPDVLQEVARRLRHQEPSAKTQRALYHLYALTKGTR